MTSLVYVKCRSCKGRALDDGKSVYCPSCYEAPASTLDSSRPLRGVGNGTCQIADCGRPTGRRGLWCEGCYRWWLRHGKKPTRPTGSRTYKLRDLPPVECEIEGCDRPQWAKCLCKTCYTWLLRKGERPLGPPFNRYLQEIVT